jgi:N6-adenosine-specific RNA methylase IME4
MKVTNSQATKAASVLKNGVAALIACVDEDKIPVSIAAKLCQMPEQAQTDATSLKVKDLRGLVKRVSRLKKSANLAKATAKATAQLGESQYAVILADPPWQYQVFSENGMDRSADNHYPTMSMSDIQSMKIPAADNCVLFLWSTVPMLEHALETLKAWGFSYRSNFSWTKNEIGTGHWNRNKHEHLLIGMKGSIPAPDPSDRDDSVIEADVREHSRKPDEIYEMIEKYYPNLPRIELFARRFRSGWDSHGAELDEITHGQPATDADQPAAA